jgi:peptide/nickel transport system permease protein
MKGNSMRRKIINYVVAFFILLVLNFVLPRMMPGDPLNAIYGEEVLVQMTPELKTKLIERFSLNKPLWEQFASYIASLAKGDLGYSYYQNAPVSKIIFSHLPWTLLLMGLAIIFSSTIGIILGIESGWRRGKLSDKTSLIGMMILSGFPNFFLGIVLLLFFAVTLRFLPLQGARTAYGNLTGGWLLLDILKHLILPLTSLTLAEMPANYLLTRNTMIINVREPFVLTAKAKGLPDSKVRYKHAGRNSLLPVVTRIGIKLGIIVTGALFVEIIFSYPGIGNLIYTSLLMRDYPVLQGSLIIVTIFVLLINLGVDLIYKKLDPRT